MVAGGIIPAEDIHILKQLGVAAVYTAADFDLPAIHGFVMLPPTMNRPPLATDRVRFVGDIVAMVIAACGVPVAKHGNRAMSSKSGTADVLAALGVNIEAPPDVVEQCLREAGISLGDVEHVAVNSDNAANRWRKLYYALTSGVSLDYVMSRLRNRGERADIAEAQDSGAIRNDGDEILTGGEIGRLFRVIHDGFTGSGYAGRIGQGQIALVA